MNVHNGAMTLQNLVLVHSERKSLMNDTHWASVPETGAKRSGSAVG